MTRKLKMATGLIAATMLALVGCDSNAPANSNLNATDSGVKSQAPAVSDAPVTLTFYVHVEAFDESFFRKYIADLVKKAHPNITLEYVGSGDRDKLAELVAAGTVPDLIFSGTDNFMGLKNLDIDEDMTTFLKQRNFDLSVFDPSTIQALRDVDDGKLPAIPFSRNAAALFYNKDIFDKLGVSYPTNEMTWDNVIELASKITTKQDGVQYVGWEPGFPDANADPFSQPFVEMKTKKALVDTPVYEKVIAMMKRGYDIPGFGGDTNKIRYTPGNFVGNKFVGMYVDWYNKMLLQFASATADGTAPNWDLVTAPNFPENVGKGRHSSVQFLLMSKQSKFKDQALQVIQTVSTLDAQLLQSRNGRIAVLSNPEVEKQFGKDTPALANKHVENLFKDKPVAFPARTLYDDEVRKIIRGVADTIATNKTDINTALREAQAAADKKIAELDAQ